MVRNQSVFEVLVHKGTTTVTYPLPRELWENEGVNSVRANGVNGVFWEMTRHSGLTAAVAVCPRPAQDQPGEHYSTKQRRTQKLLHLAEEQDS